MKVRRTSLRQTFGTNVRRERLARGLSQAELADKAGLHRTHVGSVERAENGVTIDAIEALAEALGVEAAELMRGVGPSGDIT
jgi:transcriptional regulator with XRE-family HTH domain